MSTLLSTWLGELCRIEISHTTLRMRSSNKNHLLRTKTRCNARACNHETWVQCVPRNYFACSSFLRPRDIPGSKRYFNIFSVMEHFEFVDLGNYNMTSRLFPHWFNKTIFLSRGIIEAWHVRYCLVLEATMLVDTFFGAIKYWGRSLVEFDWGIRLASMFPASPYCRLKLLRTDLSWHR